MLGHAVAGRVVCIIMTHALVCMNENTPTVAWECASCSANEIMVGMLHKQGN